MLPKGSPWPSFPANTMLLSLPAPCAHAILQRLDAASLARLGCCCTAACRLCAAPQLWHTLLLQHYGTTTQLWQDVLKEVGEQRQADVCQIPRNRLDDSCLELVSACVCVRCAGGPCANCCSAFAALKQAGLKSRAVDWNANVTPATPCDRWLDLTADPVVFSVTWWVLTRLRTSSTDNCCCKRQGGIACVSAAVSTHCVTLCWLSGCLKNHHHTLLAMPDSAILMLVLADCACAAACSRTSAVRWWRTLATARSWRPCLTMCVCR